MDVTILFMISLLHFRVVKANEQYRNEKWQTYSLDIYGDALENSELVGRAFLCHDQTNSVLLVVRR